MPELPEVETIRRQLHGSLRGATVVDTRHFPSEKFADAALMMGWRIRHIARRGKYLILSPDHADRFAIHLGMTGQLGFRDSEFVDPYERASWVLDDGRRLVFRDIRRFGRLALLPDGDTAALPTLHAMGPEPFSPEFTGDSLWRHVRRSSRQLKTQLLDQRAVAGVGNIYADEALWHAGVSPADRRLSRARATRVASAIQGVLADGVRRGGTTLRDYTNAEGNPGDNQHHLYCYGRAGEHCFRCGTQLRAKPLDGRTTTWCPHCQPRRN